MSWDAEFSNMTKTVIRWEAWYEDRALGVRGYRPARSVNVFVGPSAALMNGVYQEGLPRQLIVMPPYDAAGSPITRVSARDRITLPSDSALDDPLIPPIKSADPAFDENGVLHHFEVLA